ncbi:ER membrane protein complex subunit 10 isoform X3 [Eurosta solidaginis]|uniref:ER membrane protein complex subunit 10 isoform X2 n=1 Tax=Eurosta solidaginis TaxID=178769 RepID=UPI003531470A
MKFCRPLILLCIIIYMLKLGSCHLENKNWMTMELSHAIEFKSLDNFIYRGNVSFASFASGLAKVSQETLTEIQRNDIMFLGREDLPYRIKADVIYANGKREVFLTATKACNIVHAQLNDILFLLMDNNGYVNGVTIITTASGKCFDDQLPTSTSENFRTDIVVRHSEIAPYPDTTSFIQKLDKEREARERGEIRDNRGFFAKYWMYIVPVALLLFISGATNQDTTK